MKSLFFVLLGLLLAAPATQADELPLFQAALHGGYRMGGSLENVDTGEDADFERRQIDRRA